MNIIRNIPMNARHSMMETISHDYYKKVWDEVRESVIKPEGEWHPIYRLRDIIIFEGVPWSFETSEIS